MEPHAVCWWVCAWQQHRERVRNPAILGRWEPPHSPQKPIRLWAWSNYKVERGIIPCLLQRLSKECNESSGQFKNNKRVGLCKADHSSLTRHSILARVWSRKRDIHFQNKPKLAHRWSLLQQGKHWITGRRIPSGWIFLLTSTRIQWIHVITQSYRCWPGCRSICSRNPRFPDILPAPGKWTFPKSS